MISIVTNTLGLPPTFEFEFQVGDNVVFYDWNQNDWKAQSTLGSSALRFQYISVRDLASAGIDVERQGIAAPRLPPTGVRATP
jgi:hypothetical protein